MMQMIFLLELSCWADGVGSWIRWWDVALFATDSATSRTQGVQRSSVVCLSSVTRQIKQTSHDTNAIWRNVRVPARTQTDLHRPTDRRDFQTSLELNTPPVNLLTSRLKRLAENGRAYPGNTSRSLYHQDRGFSTWIQFTSISPKRVFLCLVQTQSTLSDLVESGDDTYFSQILFNSRLVLFSQGKENSHTLLDNETIIDF